jgi:hypothetical protein
MDSRICQTSTASPAEPGGLSCWASRRATECAATWRRRAGHKVLMEEHVSIRTLEECSLGELTESRVGDIEEHLRIWDYCRGRLQGIEPVNFVHFTEDGPVYSRATRLTTGKVIARHCGKELSGGKVCGDLSAARRYLSESFSQMFPEHTCDGRCSPARPAT